MTTRSTPFALSAILVFLLASCQITLTPGTDAPPSSGSGLEFRVTATQGLTQVRDSSDDPWRFLVFLLASCQITLTREPMRHRPQAAAWSSA